MINGDTLEVLNGPEDGATYQLLGGVADLGSGIDCAVQLRMDPYVESYQARLIGLPEGYKVRATDKGVVRVDGQRAGRVRSRLLRHGSILQVGETELYLHLAADCVEERSHNASLMQSDFGYFLLVAGSQIRRVSGGILRGTGRVLRHFLRPLYLVPVAMLVLLYLAISARGGLFHQVALIVQWGLYYVRMLMSHLG